MRHIVLVAVGLAVAPAVALAGEDMAWRNALKPTGAPAPAVMLVEAGQPVASLVVAPDAPASARKAADELRHWVAEITGGAKLPVVTAPTDGTDVRVAIDAKLAPDGYAIAVDAGDLVLSGGPRRGAVNAVYALLEEDVGCRFYTNDSIRLPKSATLAVAAVPRTYEPQLVLRDPFYHASFDAVWSLRNRTNAPRAAVAEEAGGRVDYAGGYDVHTHAALLPSAQYFKDHPDYFMLDGGGNRQPVQLCPTHPDVAKIVTANVLKLLAEHPNAEIVSVSKNDNGGDQICRCERCGKLRAAEGGSDIGPQLVLVNAVAEAVEKSHPGVLIDTLAYIETVNPPTTLRPRRNVVIRLCNDVIGAWSTPFTPARRTPMAELTKRWAAVAHRLSIWDYNVNFSHYLAPMPNMHVIADNLRFWTENKAVGVLTQGGYQSTSERDEMRAWVIAKLMWDPRREVQPLIDDFIAGHYGKAAPMLAAYERLLAASAEAHGREMANPPGGIRYPMTLGFLSKDFLREADELFAAGRQAVADDPVLLARVERAELPVMYAKLLQGQVTPELVDRFERIARSAKVDWIAEGGTRLPAQLSAWRASTQ